MLTRSQEHPLGTLSKLPRFGMGDRFLAHPFAQCVLQFRLLDKDVVFGT